MSELEVLAAPIISRLLTGLVGATLSPEEAAVLAVWGFKTAIVLNASSNYRRIVPESHFRYLYETREIPASVFVDVAGLSSDGSLASHQSQHLVGAVSGDATESLRKSSYNIVLGIARIAIRVAHLPLNEHHVVADLERQDRTRRLWPGVTEPVRFDVGATFLDLEEFEMALAFRPDSEQA